MATPPPGEGIAAQARVWDAPTRVLHWIMAALIPVLWWTGEEGEMEWHRRAGYLMLGLLVFRLLWGVFGSSTARFGSFVRGPGAVWRYFRSLLGKGEAPAFHGHNPMGGWSVVAMLAALALQVGLGLFASDVNGLETGPLAVHVSFETGRAAADLHESLFNLLLALVVLHVLTVVWYLLVRRENLVGPMVHGRASAVRGEPMRPAPLWRFAVAVLVAVAVAWFVSQGGRL